MDSTEGVDLNPVFTDVHGFRPQVRKDLGGGDGLELLSHQTFPLSVDGWPIHQARSTKLSIELGIMTTA